MPANLPPALPGPQTTAIEPYAAAYPSALQRGAEAGPPAEEQEAQVRRLLSALNRYKWLILAVVGVGSIAGVAATRFLDPKYAVASTLLLTGDEGRGGPIRVEQNLERQGWLDLLRSFAIADSVVMKLALYVRPDDAEDAPLFRGFDINRRAPRFVPGDYTLKITGPRYTLGEKIGMVTESGIVGDSIGRTAGFAWRPSRAALGTDRTVKFTVRTPRETSAEILQRMQPTLSRGSNLILLRLTGTAQEKPAETLNAWGEQFVRIATELKSGRASQFSKILNAQLAEAVDRLTAAERALQSFRMAAITQPSEGSVATGTAGFEFQRDPVLNEYFSKKLQLDNVRRDREALQRVATQVTATSTPLEALLAVPAIANDATAGPLRASLTEYSNREIGLRILRQTYTDSAIQVKPRVAELRTLQAQIPVQLAEVISQLQQREAVLTDAIGKNERDLEGIPSRTITQEALRREVVNAAQLYSSLQHRYAEAELSEKSAIADVRVLDPAVMPLRPTANTAPRLLALAVLGSLGAGIGLVFLLDRIDRRFRYPSQATKELGLGILGVVPVIDEYRRQQPERVAQIVEAFRSIRMNVRYACVPNTKVALTITSPGPDDGKSLVASNLALSFAESGWRTVLIDGDLRRGQLNVTFDCPQSPGLVDYLDGSSLLSEITTGTNHENLTLIPSGHRHRRAPELLVTPRMQELLALLARDYDAIIVDSPPLGAGTDAYALGTATGNIALVLRSATTDLRMGRAKLSVLDNLPVRVIGAILNAMDTEGAYQYYSYDAKYAMIEQPEQGQLSASSSAH